jgi:hypothetical protein
MADIQAIIPFTYKWEGGLSRATTDKASANPSPYVHQGVKGWHTNKGITYPVFKEGSKTLGYQDTAQNFLTMPEEIWLKIAKVKFWDTLKLDNVKSQAIANLMFSWIWGSGYAWRNRMVDYFKTKGIVWNKNDFNALANNLNILTEKEGEKKIFDELVEQKRQYLVSLNQPANINGWLRRLNDLQTYSYSLLGKTATYTAKKIKENPITTIVLTTVLIVASYVLYKTLIKNKK